VRNNREWEGPGWVCVNIMKDLLEGEVEGVMREGEWMELEDWECYEWKEGY